MDAAFAHRRKALRSAGIDPSARGETLDVTAFARLAAVRGAGHGADAADASG